MNIRDLITANPGMADAQILALADQNPCTVRPIRLDDLRPLLAGKGILGRLARAALADDSAANAYAYINSANATIRSDTPEYAAQLEATMAGLAMLGLTDQDRLDIVALGGGYATRGVTLLTVALERATMARENAIVKLHAALAAARSAAEVAFDAGGDVRAAMMKAFDEGWK